MLCLVYVFLSLYNTLAAVSLVVSELKNKGGRGGSDITCSIQGVVTYWALHVMITGAAMGQCLEYHEWYPRV